MPVTVSVSVTTSVAHVQPTLSDASEWLYQQLVEIGIVAQEAGIAHCGLGIADVKVGGFTP